MAKKKNEKSLPVIEELHFHYDGTGFEPTTIVVELENVDAEFVGRLVNSITALVKNPHAFVMTYPTDCVPLVK